jgi:hypothetical protein
MAITFYFLDYCSMWLTPICYFIVALDSQDEFVCKIVSESDYSPFAKLDHDLIKMSFEVLLSWRIVSII